MKNGLCQKGQPETALYQEQGNHQETSYFYWNSKQSFASYKMLIW